MTNRFLRLIPALLILISSVIAVAQTSPDKTSTDPLAKVKAEVALGKISARDLVAKYDALARRDPDNPAWYVMSAAVYSRNATPKLIQQALKIDPNYGLAYVVLADYNVMARPPECAATYQKALQLEPGNTSLRHEAIWNCAQYVSWVPQSLAVLKQIAGVSVHSRVDLARALIDAAGPGGPAETELAALEKDAPGNALVQFAEGELEFAQAQKKSDAALQKRALDRMVAAWKISPQYVDYYQKSLYPRFPSFGPLLVQAGRISDAEAFYQKGIELYPSNYSLREGLWKAWFAEPSNDYTPQRAKVRAAAQALLTSHAASPELLHVAATGYQMAGDTAKSKALEARLHAEFPYSPETKADLTEEINSTSDRHRLAQLLVKYNRDFPDPQYGRYLTVLDQIGAPAAQLRDTARILLDYASKTGFPNQYSDAVITVAQVFLHRQIDLDRVQQLLGSLKENSDALLKKENLNPYEAEVLSLRADLLARRGEWSQAQNVLTEILKKAQNLSADDRGRIESYQADAILASGKKDGALAAYANALTEAQRSWTEDAALEIREKYRKLYVALKGSDKGMAAYLSIHDNGSSAVTSDQREEVLNQPAPDFTSLDLNGKRIKLSSLRGKVVIIDFWATWCAPCRKEFPELQQFYSEMKDDPNVAVLAISVDENRALVKPFITSKGYTFPVLLDDGAKAAFKVGPIPETFVVDPSGHIRIHMTGYNGAVPLVAHLKALVDKYRTR